MDIEKICRETAAQLSRPVTFMLSSEFEANLRADNITTFPIVLYVQPIMADVLISQNENITPTYDKMIMFLDRLDNDSMDADSSEKNEAFKQMEMLCYEFFIKLSRNYEYQKANGKTMSLRIRQVSEKFDVYLSGVAANVKMQYYYFLDCDKRPN